MNYADIQSNRETPYFAIALIFSLITYLFAIISIIGVVIVLFAFLIMLLLNAIQLGSIRGNGMRVSQNQFPDIYQRAEQLSAEIGLTKTPDFFVVQSEGSLNAFATRFFGRSMIVMYSEVFDLAREQGEKELDFIIAHELAHIKRNHVWKNILTFPARFVPFLSQAYSRSCEYTCDRHAASLIQDATAAKSALTMLSVGKVMYREVNEDAFLEQIHSESNGAVWLSEVLSTHPILPKRILSVEQFFNPETSYSYRPRYGKIALTGVVLTAGFVVSIVATALAIPFGIAFLADNVDFAEEDFLANDSFSTYEALGENNTLTDEESFLDEDADPEVIDYGSTELMDAVSMSDAVEVTNLVSQGADLEERDVEGSTALLYASYANDIDMIGVLLDHGANPNVEDDYSTPLINALDYYDPEVARLLIEYGADPEFMTSFGVSAVEIAESELGIDFYEWINE
ncbi:M48 family metalloprotease [Paenalkalicoccus suaedae]|uniref:M48 family metalloprotease n=1 Tax=Paenalkalicoccus suaedae TaxID=2592382 RepID=A0A859FAL6_9BACI|nr:M48 family metalloprotease [Paenalkalicoccus suaedae]QKS69987.1 M48 family metalloprotease [Paenalkalicoccus suaedae]